jgi:hypothetical protein
MASKVVSCVVVAIAGQKRVARFPWVVVVGARYGAGEQERVG